MAKQLRYLCTLLLCMIASVGWAEKYKLTISYTDFTTSSYANNNNEKTSIAVSTSNPSKTYEVKWTSYQVYRQKDHMQWQKSNGYIYNSTNLGTITNVTITQTTTSNASFTTYYGTEQKPSTSTEVGGSFFQVKVGSTTGYTTQIDVTFEIPDNQGVATTTTITAPANFNTDVYEGTSAGRLTASVTVNEVALSNPDITWTSSDETVATIDVNGNVTLVAAGTTTITASYAGVQGQYQASSDTYELTVIDNTPFEGGDVTFVAGSDKGSTTVNDSPDEVSKSVVTISSTDAAFATSEYRFYANSTTTFSVPAGYYIAKIVFTNAGNDKLCSNLSLISENGNYSNNTWTGNATSVAFAANAQARASQIVVTVAKGTPQADPELSFSAATATATLGEDFTAPTLSNENGVDVTYSSSEESVATVDASTGVVTLVAAGETTISATFAGDDTYSAGAASYTLTVNAPVVAESDWVKTELSALTADDIFVIVGNNENDYALANDKGTGSAPTAVSVTVSGNYLTGTVADNIKWHVSGNTTDGYTFYPNGSTTTWLYCTATNNGVRVGTNENKAFTLGEDGHVKHNATNRYLAVYPTTPDWRCYTNTTTQPTTITFYKYNGVPAPSITAEAVEIAYDATSGSISYTINNGVEGGTLAATTEADWLTIGDVGTDAVAFTATLSETAIARTADVVLTYTYGTGTTSKIITVTQAGNPNAPGGTVNNPYTVAEALEVIEALADNGKTSDVYVKGTISSISEVSTEYGNATYFISGETSELEVFRGYFLENAKFIAENQIQVGDEVVVYGKLQKYVKDGNTTPEVTQGNYIVSLDRPEPVVEPGTPVAITAGFYTIKNLGNEKFVNVAGRKTVTFVGETATAPGTVIKVESNENGQVQVLRSQGVDLPGYAERAMKYVPKIVQLVAEKLGAEGEGKLLGKDGLGKIMDKFNESFDYHLYTEQGEKGVRIYGKTPSMQPVVDFYNDNKANVDAKLPMLEDFINSAINKVLEKTHGSGASILTEFSLHEIWEKMGKTLKEPVDADSKLEFLQGVLSNKQYVWDFAYQTAMKYWKPLIKHEKVQQNLKELGDLAQYVEKIEYIRPDVKYYIVQKEGKIDFISQDNTLLKETSSEWELDARETFTVNFNEENVLNDKYYTTLYTDFAYTLPEGVKAMTVAKVAELNGKNIAITETIKGAVPAQTPVLLESATAGNVELTLDVTDGTAIENLLKGNDWLVNELEITTPQVDKLFGIVHDLLEYENMGSLYDRYVKEYEYLKKRNAGTVNNKYFFGLSGDDIAEATMNICQFTKDEQGLAFSYNLEQSPANKAFLPGDKDPVYLSFVGDVDRDGDVDKDDLSALIKIILGTDTEEDNYDYDAANVNEDENENPDIADVTALVNILK